MTRKSVKDSLLLQLKVRGSDEEFNVDMVNDYMELWDTKKKLQNDIKKRGVVYEDYSSVGVKMKKSNQSVKELVMVNRQMLSILRELKLNEASEAGDEEDEL